MAQDFGNGAGAVRQPPSVSTAMSHTQTGPAPSTVQSAPARLPRLHLDGATEYSSIDAGQRSIYAATDRTTALSRSGTVREFTPETIRRMVTSVSNPAQATNRWVESNESTRYALITTKPELHKAADVCDCCRAARRVRSLEALMADDHAKTPPADDERGQYFAGLPQLKVAYSQAP